MDDNIDEQLQRQVVVFGGGCFWCTEAIFKSLRGVTSVIPGYAGGTVRNPIYEEVATGQTGHAEVVQIEYKPKEISFRDLLTVFFATHDPTTPNQQGRDVGPQYRSIILYTTKDQKKEAKEFIGDLNRSRRVGKPVVTEVQALTVFYEAETAHRDYYKNNPEAAYCRAVITPKLEKVKKNFNHLM